MKRLRLYVFILKSSFFFPVNAAVRMDTILIKVASRMTNWKLSTEDNRSIMSGAVP